MTTKIWISTMTASPEQHGMPDPTPRKGHSMSLYESNPDADPVKIPSYRRAVTASRFTPKPASKNHSRVGPSYEQVLAQAAPHAYDKHAGRV